MGIPDICALEVSLKRPNEATRSMLQNPCIIKSFDNKASSKPDYSYSLKTSTEVGKSEEGEREREKK